MAHVMKLGVIYIIKNAFCTLQYKITNKSYCQLNLSHSFKFIFNMHSRVQIKQVSSPIVHSVCPGLDTDKNSKN